MIANQDEKICPKCGTVQPKSRCTCKDCHEPFYRAGELKKGRRTRDDVNGEILKKRLKKMSD